MIFAVYGIIAASGQGGGDENTLGAHRYWRMNVREDYQTGGYVRFDEMELRDEYFGSPIEDSIPTKTASQENGTFNFSRAFDGLFGGINYYRTSIDDTVFPVFFTFDAGLGNTITIAQIVIWPQANRENLCPRDFDVQYSDDGSTWTTGWSVLDTDSANNDTPRIYTAPQATPEPVVAGWNILLLTPGYTLSEDSLTLTNTSGGGNFAFIVPTTTGATAGTGDLIYTEFLMGDDDDTEYNGYLGLMGSAGFGDLSGNPTSNSRVGRRGNGTIWHDGAEQVTGLLPYGNDDIVMVAFRPNTGQIWTGVNGVWDDDPATDDPTVTYTRLDGTFVHIVGQGRDQDNAVTAVLEEDDWTYTKPVGSIAMTDAPDTNPRGDIARIYTAISPIKAGSANADRQQILVAINGA